MATDRLINSTQGDSIISELDNIADKIEGINRDIILPSNQINAMTGYSEPSSTSAITPSNTLNEAIGKLERKADINNTNILTVANQTTKYNLADCSLKKLKTYPEYEVAAPVWNGNVLSNSNKTFTVNGDGSITVSGTTGDYTGRMTVYVGDISAGSFIKGCPEGGAISGGYLMAVYNSSGQSQAIDIGAGAIINSDISNAYIQIAVPKTVAIDSKVFKPMLIPKAVYDAGFTDYQPCAMSNVELTQQTNTNTTNILLNGLRICQQWLNTKQAETYALNINDFVRDSSADLTMGTYLVYLHAYANNSIGLYTVSFNTAAVLPPSVATIVALGAISTLTVNVDREIEIPVISSTYGAKVTIYALT